MIDKKGLGDFIVMSVFIILAITAVAVLSYYLIPILSNAGDFRDIGDTLSPSENYTNNVSGVLSECSSISAYWENDSAVEGTQVKVIVNGENCGGEEVNFRIYEEDYISSDDEVNHTPSNSVFINLVNLNNLATLLHSSAKFSRLIINLHTFIISLYVKFISLTNWELSIVALVILPTT